MRKKNSIEMKIAGGLGNQLFMLCAGTYLQSKSKRQVIFDISDLERISKLHPGHNVYSLGLLEKFEIRGSKRKRAIQRYLQRIGVSGLTWISNKTPFINRRRNLLISEVGFFDLCDIPKTIKKIEGYFQSWRYFSEITEDIFQKIESIKAPSEWFLNELESTSQKQYAAIHIRRGDYKLKINRQTGILSLTYFEKIAKLIPEDIEILIFTDSVDDMKHELVEFRRKFRIVEPPANSDPVESLMLMSKAAHIAISNSTFSWWAATFSGDDSTVYAPTKWFEQREDPKDLYPDNWVKIQSEWEPQK